jgi:uncharacterized RDD family membrane protein YckC
MKPRFEPDGNPAPKATREATLVDPDGYDASEQQFAASLERKPRTAKFVVDEAGEDLPQSPAADDGLPPAEVVEPVQPRGVSDEEAEMPERIPEAPAPTGDSWRQEVQAKITHYRARKRPRPPRYPSLQLKFESAESSWNKGTSQLASSIPPTREAVATQTSAPVFTPEPVQNRTKDSFPAEETGKLLEFPRPAAPVLPARDELAEPVLDQPRILEVPEVLPPPPALGGILIEPPEDTGNERRRGLELPLQAAPMFRRVLASAVDGMLVLSAVGLFAYTFFRITSNIPPPRQIAVVSAALTGIFWSGYQYLLLVYAGATPGLKLAGLRLSRFDGSQVPRYLRRWRVLASVLAGLSLMLGYVWCFFDEDELCWHDRITHTYMAPQIKH